MLIVQIEEGGRLVMKANRKGREKRGSLRKRLDYYRTWK